jgi:hypothetical protein
MSAGLLLIAGEANNMKSVGNSCRHHHNGRQTHCNVAMTRLPDNAPPCDVVQSDSNGNINFKPCNVVSVTDAVIEKPPSVGRQHQEESLSAERVVVANCVTASHSRSGELNNSGYVSPPDGSTTMSNCSRSAAPIAGDKLTSKSGYCQPGFLHPPPWDAEAHPLHSSSSSASILYNFLVPVRVSGFMPQWLQVPLFM